MTIASVIGDPISFLDRAFARALALGIDIDDFDQIDHMCYRTSSIEEYKSLLRTLTCTAAATADNNSSSSALGFILVESMIGGRPIAIVELYSAICYKGKYRIKHIEVPSPKAGSPYESGLEHLEVVLGEPGKRDPIDSREALLAFAQQAQARNPLLRLGLKAIDKHVNADVSLDLDDRTTIKFHICPIEEVVRLEKEMNLAEAVPSEFYA